MSHHPSDKYWLGFNLVSGIGTAKLQALLDHYGSIEAAWQASEAQMQRLGLDQRSRQNLIEARQTLDLDQKLAQMHKAGLTLLHWAAEEYPAILREVPTPPPVLFMHGRLQETDQFALAIVGTRRLTSYGRQIAKELTAGLVRHNITIVSGLARGIDAIAHKTALEMGGRTIAVLGSGTDEIYPPENRQLAKQIVEQQQGAVITEYPLGTKPHARNFPPRNRIISGLSLGTIVIEGDVDSGAMITAQFALEQNREVFAVPGPITSPVSNGPNHLIQQGAKLVMRVEDVLDELNLRMVSEKAAVQLALPESAEEVLILEQLSRDPQHVDELCRLTALPSATVSSTLTLLELKGVVQHVGGLKYTLFR